VMSEVIMIETKASVRVFFRASSNLYIAD